MGCLQADMCTRVYLCHQVLITYRIYSLPSLERHSYSRPHPDHNTRNIVLSLWRIDPVSRWRRRKLAEPGKRQSVMATQIPGGNSENVASPEAKVLEYAKRQRTIFYVVMSCTILVSVLLLIASSIGIAMWNQYISFGPDPPKGFRTFFIVMLVISIIFFAVSIAAISLYGKWGYGLAPSEQKKK